MPGIRADLESLIRIPSVSAYPAAADAMLRSADAVAALFEATGLERVEVVRVHGGQPAVLGHRPGPAGAPTVLLYAHHDVQPAGDLADWDTEPFEPAERDGRLFARGAADDKAGIVLHLAALRALGDDLRVGVTVLIDGEEEIGSPSLAGLLDRYGDRLAPDVAVLADSTNWRIGVPALTTSLRGGVNVVVEVRTLRHAVHNGVYGGPVPDALTALARLLATLHDERGEVAVAGLAHGMADPLDLTEAQLRADAGLLDGVQLLGAGPLTSRMWTRPAISVIGVDAPAVDTAAMTLVPSGRAKITLRVAPGDDADAAGAALAAHLRAHAPWGASVTVNVGKSVQPIAVRTDGPAYTVARAALSEAWGAPAVDIGVGGSIDFVGKITRRFPDAEILVTGVEDPDTRAHGANESLHLAEFERACVAEALLLARLPTGNAAMA
jgi:acetylornithine deacetylase/succinyl-diaminopimelate desuccinylase-like protein